MVKFFRDILSGPLYVIVVLVSLVLIMAIIGFLMEKKQKQEEANSKVVRVGNKVKANNDINEIPDTSSENTGITNENNQESSEK